MLKNCSSEFCIQVLMQIICLSTVSLAKRTSSKKRTLFENVVKENNDTLRIIVVLRAYIWKELGFIYEK